MKNILVPTDFSLPAENAARYAIAFAKQVSADVMLCTAYKAPSDAPISTQVVWPLLTEDEVESQANDQLVKLAKKIKGCSCEMTIDFCPQITVKSGKGEVVEVVSALVKSQKIDLVVMGMKGAGRFVQWVLGSNSKKMIDDADFPVLYVPYPAKFKSVKKIAFATDLSPADLKPLNFLLQLAATITAEICVYHICSFEEENSADEQGLYEYFYEQIISKLDYPHVKFEYIWHSDVDEGLQWMSNNSEIDLLAMVHRKHSLLDKLVNGSYVHQLARITKIPLLVFKTTKDRDK